jgi:hypothetical protein
MTVNIRKTVIINFAPQTNIVHFNHYVDDALIIQIDYVKRIWCSDSH